MVSLVCRCVLIKTIWWIHLGMTVKRGMCSNQSLMLFFDRLLKHLESYTSPILHTELGNCYMQLKHYQEAMDQYGLALWYVFISQTAMWLMYVHTGSHLAVDSWFKGNSIAYQLLKSTASYKHNTTFIIVAHSLCTSFSSPKSGDYISSQMCKSFFSSPEVGGMYDDSEKVRHC